MKELRTVWRRGGDKKRRGGGARGTRGRQGGSTKKNIDVLISWRSQRLEYDKTNNVMTVMIRTISACMNRKNNDLNPHTTV